VARMGGGGGGDEGQEVGGGRVTGVKWGDNNRERQPPVYRHGTRPGGVVGRVYAREVRSTVNSRMRGARQRCVANQRRIR